ncbi:hypothetical protein ACJJI4_13775 [Microbulbifer sp. TRSA002]|uniref:hypothetical protein n=1 Tax=Microbulbifer sp. TRSA002 TaxID=3243382 RepID=UPI00403A4C7E
MSVYIVQYPDGCEIELGDTVSLAMPNGWAEARVVMLGSTREHLNMTAEDLDWYSGEGLEPTSILVEWLKDGKPKRGAYMSIHVDCCIELISRDQS